MSPAGSSDAGVRGWRARDVVRLTLVVVAVSLGAVAVARDLEGFLSGLRSIGLVRGFAGFLIVVVGQVISGEVWRAAIAATAGALSPSAARRVFFVTQLGKYLPGAVWPVLAQVEAARRHGLAASRMAIGSLLFLALHLLTGLVVAASLTPWASPDVVSAYPWVFLLTPLLVIGLLPPVLGRVIDLGLRMLRRQPLPARLSARDIGVPSLLLMATWLAYGLGAFVVAAPLQVAGSTWQLFAAATGGFAAAWAVGVLVLPAPAGVGAREVVLVLALAPVIGVTGATSVAIVLRVIHTAGDLVLAGGARLAGATIPGTVAGGHRDNVT